MYVHVHVRECIHCSLGLSRNDGASMYVHAHAHIQVHPSLVHHLHHYGVCACTYTQQGFFVVLCGHIPEPEMRRRECERVSVCEKVAGEGGGDYSKVISRCSYL